MRSMARVVAVPSAMAFLAVALFVAVGLPSAVAAVRPSGVLAAGPGSKLWVSRFNGPANSIDEAAAVGVSPDGSRVYVTGSTGPAGHEDYETIAYDAATGSRLWSGRYDGPVSGSDRAAALGVSPDGATVFVTGTSLGARYGLDEVTIAYDAATGSRLWVYRYTAGPTWDDYAAALDVGPEGTEVCVTGYASGGGGTIYSTVCYDDATGTPLMAQLYYGEGGHAKAIALAVSRDNSTVFVTGTDTAGGDSNYTTFAYFPTSQGVRWVQTSDFGPVDSPDALDLSPDGSKVFVTGRSARSGSNFDYATVAYDAATGAQLWVSRYNGPGDGDDSAAALAVSPDGSTVFVSGGSAGAASGQDYTTIAYDAATGARRWLKRYDGGVNGDDIASALGVSPDGSQVFVTGESAGSTSGDDYATVAYDSATGSRLWVKRYDGPPSGIDDAAALAIEPDGAKVFVTGRSEGTGSGFDYATIAYSSG
jgi:PQQ-like domain